MRQISNSLHLLLWLCDADPEIKHTLHLAFLSHVQYGCEGRQTLTETKQSWLHPIINIIQTRDLTTNMGQNRRTKKSWVWYRNTSKPAAEETKISEIQYRAHADFWSLSFTAVKQHFTTGSVYLRFIQGIYH